MNDPNAPSPGPLDYAAKTDRRVQSTGWFYRMRQTVAVALLQICAVIVVTSLFIFATGFGRYAGPGVIVGLLGVFWLIALSSIAGRRARAGRADRILAYTAHALSAGLPLPDYFDSVAQDQTGRMRKRLFDVALDLRRGVDLPAALTHAVPELPARTLDRIEAAQADGSLPRVMQQLKQERARERESTVLNVSNGLGYTMFVLYALVIAFAFYCVFILPRFVEIFRDFGIASPLLEATRTVASWLFETPAAVVLFIVLIIVGGKALMEAVRGVWSSQHDKPDGLFTHVRRRLRDMLAWHTPLLGRQTADRAWADYFGALAGSVDAARPLDVGATASIGSHMNEVARHRALTWSALLKQGRSPVDAGRAAGLPRLLTGLLGTASSTNQVAEVCRIVSARFHERARRRADVVRSILPATLALVGGLGVGLFALSVFVPIVQLISATSGATVRVLP
ncbi:MAG: type II secretion system F family protein [Tepidisphaeraceae bacterium]